MGNLETRANFIAAISSFLVSIMMVMRISLELRNLSPYLPILSMLAYLLTFAIVFYSCRVYPNATWIKWAIIAILFSTSIVGFFATKTSQTAFLISIYTILICLVFEDRQLTNRINLLALLVNIVIIWIEKYVFKNETLTLFTIVCQIFVLIASGTFLTQTTKLFMEKKDFQLNEIAIREEKLIAILEELKLLEVQLTNSVASTQKSVTNAFTVADSVLTTVEDFSTTSESISIGAESQSASVMEIDEYIQILSDRFLAVHADLNETLNVTDKGSIAMSKVVNSLEKVNDIGLLTQNSLKSLNDNFKQINAVIDIIEGIADQTQLLAFKASN